MTHTKKPTSAELKCCPCCGNAAKISSKSPDYFSDKDWTKSKHKIKCTVCPITTGWFADKDKLIVGWNTRATPPRPSELNELGRIARAHTKLEEFRQPIDNNSRTKPLIKRYTDESGNEMVAVAAWFYDEMVKAIPEDGPSDKERAEALEIFDRCFPVEGYGRTKWYKVIRSALLSATGRLAQKMDDNLEVHFNHIENLMSEFEEYPENALECIGEYIGEVIHKRRLYLQQTQKGGA